MLKILLISISILIFMYEIIEFMISGRKYIYMLLRIQQYLAYIIMINSIIIPIFYDDIIIFCCSIISTIHWLINSYLKGKKYRIIREEYEKIEQEQEYEE